MDVIICGAGIVGLVLANLLCEHTDLQIAVIDPHPPLLNFADDVYDVRCSAISRAAEDILKNLGVWEQILEHRAGVYEEMLIWSDEIHNNLHFAANSIHQPHLGHIIENRVLLQSLYNNVKTRKNVRIIHATPLHLQDASDSIVVSIADEMIHGKLLIAADGANSWVRKALNIASYGWDYNQTALVATVHTEHSHTNCAMQRFTTDAILAFLPLADPNLCSIVWSCATSRALSLLHMEEELFNKNLAREFAFKLGQVALCGGRATFPLRLQHATEYVRNRAVLLGDAAHVVHPMAGLGLNLGILDAQTLYMTLRPAILHGGDIGAMAVLRKYARQRRWHNTAMIFGIDMLHKTFLSANKNMAVLRAIGMRMCNQSTLGKNLIMRFASSAGYTT